MPERSEAFRQFEEPKKELSLREKGKKEYEEYWENISKELLDIEEEMGDDEKYEEYSDRLFELRRAEEDFSPVRRKAYLEQGAEFVVDMEEKDVDTLVFLDRSARPLASFFRALWRRLYPDKKPPEMKFVLINTRHGIPIDPEQVKEVFVKVKDDFDNKKVLIVDDIIDSGKTLKNIWEVLEEAFPNMKELFLGAMFETNLYDQKNRGNRLDLLDINPPEGSGEVFELDDPPMYLGYMLHGSTNEIEEPDDAVLGRVNRKKPASKTFKSRLSKVGKWETLGDESIEGMDEKIENEDDEKKKARLEKIKEAYLKLQD